ncbi:MAG: L-rhamnose mutarotase [Phycisphaerales bacterium]|nr:L-rhamnose mutarotase [Phycisphaerales bacterium]
MRSYAQVLDLKNDPTLIAEYKDWHTRVWPEVLNGLRAIGIRRMKIFLLGTHLFMYYEAPDDFNPARDYQNYAKDPRVREWDTLMRTFQQRVAEAPPASSPSDWWTPMEEVFDLETASQRSS